MKKIICFLALIAMISIDVHAQIHSTSTGGYWNDRNTWVGGTIPGSSNDVIIEGPVILASASGYTILTEYCNNLTITETGSLKNGDYGGGSGIYPLEVSGNVVNNGTVTLGPNDLLKIYISGDLENNNIWMPYMTEFRTSNNHNLSLKAGKSFGSRIFNNGSPSFTALTDMLFTCDFIGEGNYNRENFYLNGHTLNIGNHSIEMRKCLINRGTLTGDFHIKGNFKVDMDPNDTLAFVGNIVVEDTLTCHEYGGGYAIEKLKVIGNITNNGVITDNDGGNPDDFSLLITGNIINNGEWTCNFVNFIGTGTQYISQTAGKLFDSNFVDLNPSSKVQALSDISIKKDFNLNGTTLEMEGNMLYISGWLHHGYINNTKLQNGFLQNIISLNNLIIEGKVTVESNNVFQNSVVVNDTLQNTEYGGGYIVYTLKIEGDILNNGLIQNYSLGNQLSVEITGNVENNGQWKSGFTKFKGTNTQHISSLSGHILDGEFSDMDSTSSVIANSNLSFSGNINLGRGILDMQNKEITFKRDKWLSNGYLKNAKMSNGLLSNLRLLGSTEINGKVEISDNVDAVGSIVVNDTLCAMAYSGGTTIYNFTLYGNISNNGLVGQIYDDLLSFKANGDITNKGIWNAYSNYFLFYLNKNTCSLKYLNTNISDLQINGSVITGSGANLFSIISGGGMKTVPKDQSYDLTVYAGATGSDFTANLNLDCSQIGSLNNITLIGYNYPTVLTEERNINLSTNGAGLNQNFPNPFNQITRISWQSSMSGWKTLKILDIYGKELSILLNEYKPAGNYEVEFNRKTLPAGIYFYQLIESNSKENSERYTIQTKKMVLSK